MEDGAVNLAQFQRLSVELTFGKRYGFTMVPLPRAYLADHHTRLPQVASHFQHSSDSHPRTAFQYVRTQ
jgi:hypothetical protein